MKMNLSHKWPSLLWFLLLRHWLKSRYYYSTYFSRAMNEMISYEKCHQSMNPLMHFWLFFRLHHCVRKDQQNVIIKDYDTQLPSRNISGKKHNIVNICEVLMWSMDFYQLPSGMVIQRVAWVLFLVFLESLYSPLPGLLRTWLVVCRTWFSLS